MKLNGRYVTLFGSNIEGNELNNFMTILIVDLYFKINCWMYESILKVLVKILLNLISFS